MEEAGEAFGYGPPSYDRPLRFKIVNPHGCELTQPVGIEVDNCEAHRHQLSATFTVFDVKTNEVIKCVLS